MSFVVRMRAKTGAIAVQHMAEEDGQASYVVAGAGQEN